MSEPKNHYEHYLNNREEVMRDADQIISDLKLQPGMKLCNKCETCFHSCPLNQELESRLSDVPMSPEALDYF